jgi:glycosyltransferase involved in cell wall biosynthesis
MTLAVVIPAFNEGGKIGSVLAGMPDSVEGHRVAVVVVDDGSTDDTSAIAEASGVRVLRRPQNGGKGCALRLGMEETTALGMNPIVWMDGDGQHRPKDLPSIVGPVVRGEADMVVGSRYLESASPKAPLNRRLVRKAAIAAIGQITGQQLTDPFSGYRCFSDAAARAVHLEGDSYESELEAFFCVWRAALSVVETPIPRVYGPGTSKMGFHRGRIRGRVDVIRGYARTIRRSASRTDIGEPVNG